MSFTGEPRHCVEPVSHDASGAPARTMGRVGGRLQSQWQAELAKRREAETSRVVTVLMRRRQKEVQARHEDQLGVTLRRDLRKADAKTLLGIDPIDFLPAEDRERRAKEEAARQAQARAARPPSAVPAAGPADEAAAPPPNPAAARDGLDAYGLSLVSPPRQTIKQRPKAHFVGNSMTGIVKADAGRKQLSRRPGESRAGSPGRGRPSVMARASTASSPTRTPADEMLASRRSRVPGRDHRGTVAAGRAAVERWRRAPPLTHLKRALADRGMTPLPVLRISRSDPVLLDDGAKRRLQSRMKRDLGMLHRSKPNPFTAAALHNAGRRLALELRARVAAVLGGELARSSIEVVEQAFFAALHRGRGFETVTADEFRDGVTWLLGWRIAHADCEAMVAYLDPGRAASRRAVDLRAFLAGLQRAEVETRHLACRGVVLAVVERALAVARAKSADRAAAVRRHEERAKRRAELRELETFNARRTIGNLVSASQQAAEQGVDLERVRARASRCGERLSPSHELNRSTARLLGSPPGRGRELGDDATFVTAPRATGVDRPPRKPWTAADDGGGDDGDDDDAPADEDDDDRGTDWGNQLGLSQNEQEKFRLREQERTEKRQRARELLEVDTERQDVAHRVGTFVGLDGVIHHTKARPASFQFNKLDDVAAPKIEDERVGDLAHRLDNIFDHHSVEEKVVEVDAKADKPQFDALGHRIPKKKKKKEVEITYRRGAKASADAKEQFKQLRSMMPEAHTYPG